MLPELAYQYGRPCAQALFKTELEDFIVEEVLPFEFTGEGEHMCVHLEKRGQNTTWLADQLAKVCQTSPKNVSYAGLKDRQGITRQWFSVQLPGKGDPDLAPLLGEQVALLDIKRHSRKLKRGALSGNRFKIRLREVSDIDAVADRLTQIQKSGVPNYFGPQRFGRQGRNLEAAARMFKGQRVKDRNKRSIYLSAARSLLFNEIVSKRIVDGKFTTPMPGECFGLTGSHSFFQAEPIDESILNRLDQRDIQLTAPLYGRGELPSSGQARELEAGELSHHPVFCAGLEQAGLRMERRPISLYPEDLEWQVDGESILVSFFLPAGCYATSVLREVVFIPSSEVYNEVVS